jgi:citrate synthase
MRQGVAELSSQMGEPRWLAILEAVVAAMAPYARHGVNVNVDFYSGVGYRLLGIPPDLFVPVFAMGRIPGWTVQCQEQQANNILIRPLTLYDGPQPRDYVPLEER